MTDYIAWFSDITREDGARVGGKNASLGELVRNLSSAGVNVPNGFAVTVAAYRLFLKENNLEEKLARKLKEYEENEDALAEVGKAVRAMILDGAMPRELEDAVIAAYHELGEGGASPSVAARSSATAEDLPEASFAGQLETFLNVKGDAALVEACRKCFASLYTDRAISYRRNHGFGQLDVAVSVGVQRMVRSDLASSGVMFSIDTESGFPNAVLINGAWGLGETVVQGTVDPDEFEVFKPLLNNEKLTPILRRKCGAKKEKLIYAEKGERPVALKETSAQERSSFVLNEDEILTLARWAGKIEDHYGGPMDMEWAKDGETGELFIVQARPETVQARRAAGALKTYSLKSSGEKLLEGAAIGDAIARGKVCRIDSAENIAEFEEGSVLVTQTTDPDWAPIMKKAAAIVTDHGGRTSHAAIVSRELGLPAIVGAGNATAVLQSGQEVTVSCAEGETGYVYDGLIDFDVEDLDLSAVPETRTQIMLNMANPSAAYRWWRLPSDGVGLARIEFIISDIIKIHPLALVRFDALEDNAARQEIEKLTAGYADKKEYFIDLLSRGVARIAAAHYPNPVIVRLSDFKTNEYASLLGGRQFEPEEDNPMIGWRGASRYYHDDYRDGFAMECAAMTRARETLGFTNIKLMVPFCRTLEEADKVIDEMAAHGLNRGGNGLEIYVMAEIPSNIVLANEFADRFDGFSIGSNDLTQLTLGIDRDSASLRPLFDERNPAVKTLIAELIEKASTKGVPVGICGQAPSDYPEFSAFLVETGVTSISVNPDSFLKVKETVAAAEKKAG
ncbi:MAG: phosphoenolpyruvate synthase [Parvularcula sp.]|nr:phosphoenolpyruvate synthase [Parvularcula sp.]